MKNKRKAAKARIVGKKTTARKTAARKKTVKKKRGVKITDQLEAIRQSIAATELSVAAVNHNMNSVRHAMTAIKHDQQAIAQIVDAIVKDYIRHPLKIEGINYAAHRKLVEEAARNNSEAFND